MRAKSILLAGLLLTQTCSFAARFWTIAGGNFFSGSIWNTGVAPTCGANDTVWVRHATYMYAKCHIYNYGYLKVDSGGTINKTNITFINYGRLEVYGYVEVPGGFTNSTAATVSIFSSGTMKGSTTFVNNGTFNLYGTFNVAQQSNNYSTGTMNLYVGSQMNNTGAFYNYGKIYTSGTLQINTSLYNYDPGEIYIYSAGKIDANNYLNNFDNIEVYGILDIGMTATNKSTGRIYLYSSGTFYARTTLANNGTIENNGFIEVSSTTNNNAGSELLVYTSGTFKDNGSLNNYAAFDVYGTVNVSGTLTNKSTGVLNLNDPGTVWAATNFLNYNVTELDGGSICWKNQTNFGSPNVITGYGQICGKYYSEGPLPIELLDFQAVKKNDVVELSWVTVNEENNDHFNIMRSSDLKTWEPVVEVKGSGMSHGRLEYGATDQQPLNGINYYRLQQTDFNGTTQVFGDHWIRTVDMKGRPEATMHLFPNPVPHGTNLTLLPDQDYNGQIRMIIYDINGRQIRTTVLDNLSSGTPSPVETSFLKPGTYLLEISNNGLSQKLVFAVR